MVRHLFLLRFEELKHLPQLLAIVLPLPKNCLYLLDRTLLLLMGVFEPPQNLSLQSLQLPSLALLLLHFIGLLGQLPRFHLLTLLNSPRFLLLYPLLGQLLHQFYLLSFLLVLLEVDLSNAVLLLCQLLLLLFGCEYLRGLKG